MATNTAPLPAPVPAPIRRELQDAQHAYELTVVAPFGAYLHVTEGTHDAALQLTPAQIVELRADLATVLIQLGHGLPQTGTNGVRSPAGVAIIEHLRHVIAAVDTGKHREEWERIVAIREEVSRG